MKLKIWQIILVLCIPIIIYWDIQWYIYIENLEIRKRNNLRVPFIFCNTILLTILIAYLAFHTYFFEKILKMLNKEIKF